MASVTYTSIERESALFFLDIMVLLVRE
jgi:hypothetical protein